MALKYTAWLDPIDEIKSADSSNIQVYELDIDYSDAAALEEWAKHFREHYCLDSKIDRLRRGTGKSRAEYLLDTVFPDDSDDFGPATRSGDFAEILIADLLESKLDFWVPRVRYDDKMVRNESPKGTDVIGFKFARGGPSRPSNRDVVVSFETKAQLSGKTPKCKLQEAVVDSSKDALRLAESLNAAKRRLLYRDDESGADRVERFQDGLTVPYTRKYGAAAVFCSSIYNSLHISKTTDCSDHVSPTELMLIVVQSVKFMKAVHALYAKAASDADNL